VLRHDSRAVGEQHCLTTGPLAWGAFPFLGRKLQPPAFLAVALKLLAHCGRPQCAGINDSVRRRGYETWECWPPMFTWRRDGPRSLCTFENAWGTAYLFGATTCGVDFYVWDPGSPVPRPYGPRICTIRYADFAERPFYEVG
jgi:hypothetical protein